MSSRSARPFDFNARMQAHEATEAISAATGQEPSSVEAIGDGWDHWTFLVDGGWIFRFPRREDSARSLQRELRLLPELANHVNFDVPEPSVVGSWNRFPFMGYPMIQGRPLAETDGDRPATLARLIECVEQLHAFSIDRAADLLGDQTTAAPWIERYERLAAETASSVAPLLPSLVAARLESRFEAFLDLVADFTPALVHGDLGPEHVRIDGDTLDPVGFIDFGDAAIGDPAIDYVGFRIQFGSQKANAMAARTLIGSTDGFTDRIDGYWWIGSVHAVLYGISEDDDAMVADGLSGVTRRLAALDA